MKTFFTLITYFIIYPAIAQQKQGIYLTYNDYQNNHLSFKGNDCEKIAAHTFLDLGYITVKLKNSTKRLYKDSIYGMLNCSGQLVRFYQNEDYTLIEKKHVWIYEKTETDFENGTTDSKGFHYVSKYLFSLDGNGKLQALTVNNLKQAFIQNAKTYNLLDLHFQNDRDLIYYDAIKKEYRINEILDEVE